MCPPPERDIAADRNRNYAKWLRDFSISLDECTERSFCAAVRKLTARNSVLPIVPLVLGGDDLTVVCDGRQALAFAREFVKEFEKETSNYLASSGFRKNRLTSCAGVAIVKPHFPFYDAYELAEQLLKSAKKLAKHDNDNFVSAIDYHILYDASGPDLRRIRDELTTDNGTTSLVARPYVVTESAGPHHRHIGDLVKRIDAIRAKDSDGRRLLPNSMLHELREALFWGREEAEARLDLVRHRYKPHIDALLVNGKLFWQDGNHHMTGFLDALDTAEFWE
ncbi:MAG: hypothetical protein KatS3mg110_0502 [Pirellulaceae bacterium]|nr:MAG: hypothetical protein KatS3mg110_0502 [Pirellulaceae bacterium]